MKPLNFVAGTALVICAGAVNAAPVVTLSSQGVLHTTVVGATEYTFNDFSCPYASCVGNYKILTNSVSGKSAKPLGTDSNFLTVPYNNSSGLVTLGLGFNANYYGIYWGSIDSYNSIAFYDNDKVVATFTGSNLVGQFANGNQLSYSSNRYINFQFAPNEQFNKVELKSTNWAFESDNHAVLEVQDAPEPATAMLMLAGMLGIAGVSKHRLKS
jgi:hypothetical protein